MAIPECPLRKLPPAIEAVAIPRYFSPSQWTRMESCPLSVWSRGFPTLPEPIETTVGRIFHRAREIVLDQAVPSECPEELADEALSVALAEVVGQDESKPDAKRDSIQIELGRCRWIDLVGDLRRWAVSARSLESKPLRRLRPRKTSDDSRRVLERLPDQISFGAERTWVSNALRLCGRPDQSWRDDDLSVEVRDYKSSGAVFLEGSAHEAAHVQVRLYLLMAEVLTACNARGFLVGRSLTPVRWDSATREELVARVHAAQSAFPPREEADSRALGRPGSHCRCCDLRPSCNGYLSTVPTWWRDHGTPPRPLPLDVWGHIERLVKDSDGVCVWLRDAAARLVVIRGLSPTWQLDQIRTSDTIHFFGLEPTEDLVIHGRRVHPTAFHESTRSPGRRCASRLRVFVA